MEGASVHWIVSGVLFATLVALTVACVRLWRRTRVLRQQVEALATAAGAMPARVDALDTAAGHPRITIEILNPLELARQQSWLAGTLGTLSPSLIRRVVNDRTVKILSAQLVDYGVQAEVRVERVDR